MTLVDTSVWVDFFRGGDQHLASLLTEPGMVCHPMIIGELACGNLPNRAFALRRLRNLQQAQVIDDDALLNFIDRHNLYGRGVGYVDTHLPASSLLGNTRWLWTRDKRLNKAAAELGVAYVPPVQ